LPTHELIAIRWSTWDLRDLSATDGGKQGCHIHFAEEVAARGVRRWTPEFDSQRLGLHGVVADGESPKDPQALAVTQDFQHRSQQRIPARKPNPAPHPSAHLGSNSDSRSREIGCCRNVFKH
jgi:hypothetical protein